MEAIGLSFVGLILLVMGCIIFLSGVYDALFPPSTVTRLASLHPAIWWGAAMALFGAAIYMKTRKGSERQ